MASVRLVRIKNYKGVVMGGYVILTKQQLQKILQNYREEKC